ncbi:hypothetical protein Q8F55_007501 [Vanrija albida]|uniref:Uncharacterized protein n=1 Tax=Vanrija albida TaxID=181172 RepID=A0ABR3PTQ7_9TREE
MFSSVAASVPVVLLPPVSNPLIMQPYGQSAYGQPAYDPRLPPTGMGVQPAYQPGVGMQSSLYPGQPGYYQPHIPSYFQAWSPQNLGYDYNLPALSYKPDPSMDAWQLANAQYQGTSSSFPLERSIFDELLRTVSKFRDRHLSHEKARDAHKRVYHDGLGHDENHKIIGGAVAYEAYLMWERDHGRFYQTLSIDEQRRRLQGLTVGELCNVWDRIQPRSSHATFEDAREVAIATALYIFDRRYAPEASRRTHHPRHGSFREESEAADYDRQRNTYGRDWQYPSTQLPYAPPSVPGAYPPPAPMPPYAPPLLPPLGPLGALGGGIALPPLGIPYADPASAIPYAYPTQYAYPYQQPAYPQQYPYYPAGQYAGGMGYPPGRAATDAYGNPLPMGYGGYGYPYPQPRYM